MELIEAHMDYLSFLVCLSMAWVVIRFLISITKKGRERNRRRLPPGPPPLPIFGNLFSLGNKPHISLNELAKTYGPLITLQLGQVPTVIISSASVAKEALQKNDLALSNRMVIDAVRALNHHQKSVVFLPVGPQWRNLRTICNSQVFSISRLAANQSLRRNKVTSLVSYVQKCSKEGIAVDIGQAALVTSLNLLSNVFFSVDLADFSSESAREFKEIVRGILEEVGRPNLSDYFPLLSFLVCLLIAWLAIHFLISITKKGRERNPRRLPPGPPPLPIFGNLFSLGSKPHISLAQLARTYGPLMTLKLGQVPTVIISSASVAKEALQKNDAFLSNRMVIDAARALNHHENSIGFLPVGPKWRNLRKICNSQVFSIRRLEASQNLRRNKVINLLSYVRKCSKEGIVVEIGQAAFVITLNLLSNIFFLVDLADFSSESAHEFKEIVRALSKELGKPNFADYFPFLRRMDIQGIRQRTTVHLQKISDIFKTIIDQRLQGERPPAPLQSNDVLDALLGTINQENTEEIEQSHIPHLLMDLFVAGTDTTSSTIEWAMAELLHNPEKMKKAQAELKEIIGKGNPVEEPDIVRLPYLQAIIKETFRLHPPAPFLVPRKADSDVSLFGFTVPKNAQVLVNVWAIGRDPEIWQNPNSFEPERFLGSEYDVKGRDFELIPFGAGRRICPGLPLAIRMIPTILGSMILEFDWELEGGTPPEELDMQERFGFSLMKAQHLRTIPICV